MNCCSILCAALMLTCFVANAADAGDFTVRSELVWKDGTVQDRAAFRQSPARDLVGESFRWSGFDLTGAGRPALVVQSTSSTYCGSTGCTSMVMTRAPNGASIKLWEGTLGDRLAITNQLVGGARALVALDDRGAIARSDRDTAGFPAGAPLVYALAGGYAIAARPVESPPMTAVSSGGTQTQTSTGVLAPAAGSVPNLDVLGIRLGMSPAEVQPLLARLVGKGTVYPPTRQQLAFASKAGQMTGIPGSEYVSQMVGRGNDAEGRARLIIVTFSSEPGAERVIRVDRRDAPLGPDRPSMGTYASVTAALTQKYGRPTEHDIVKGPLYWAFDVQGRPRAFDWKGCGPVMTSSVDNANGWPGLNDGVLQSLEQLAQQCGRAFAGAVASTTTGGSATPDALISGMSTTIIDLGGALSSVKRARATIESAAKQESASTVREARKKRPDL